MLLQGSGVDPDGVSLSYLWRQDGGFSVDLDDADSPNAAFAAPRVSTELNLDLRLTVTDAEGATSSDRMTVRVLSPGAVRITPTSGNTGSPGAIARFSVRLQSKPTTAVRIPLWSSDESEGVSETEALEFTPKNWDRWQTVRVRGTNAAIRGGRQHYWLRLGAIESADPAYSGLDPEDVLLRGLFLELEPPESPGLLMPGMAGRIRVHTSYSGHSVLSHALDAAPLGARIDLTTGRISWTPGREAEGGVFDFAVRVTDNSLFATTRFQVRVARPSLLPVVQDAAQSSLVVTDSDTGLDGLRIGWAAAGGPGLVRSNAPEPTDLSALHPEVVVPQEAPTIPKHIERLSEILLFRNAVQEAVTLRFPLPPGKSKGVTLYIYGDAIDVPQPFWIPIGLPRRILDGNRGKLLEITLPRIEGLLFVGRNKPKGTDDGVRMDSLPRRMDSLPREYSTGGLGPGSIPAPRLQSRANPSAVSCRADPAGESDSQFCTSTEDPGLEVHVQGFGAAGSGTTRWQSPGIRVEAMIAGLLDARTKATELGMRFDDSLSISLEDWSGIPRLGRSLGYVDRTGTENYSVLHINRDESLSSAIMQSVVAHEFFHHAQARIGAPGERIIERPNHRVDYGLWLLESTAEWFEDFVYNDLNFYKRDIGPPILNGGLAISPYNYHFGVRTELRGLYDRVTFFLLLSRSCPGFRKGLFPNLLVTNLQVDTSGLRKLRAEIQKETYACDFGAHLGESRKSSLEAALSYYQYVTQFRNQASLLDDDLDVPDGSFDAPVGTFVNPADFPHPCTSAPTTILCLHDPDFRFYSTIPILIPPAGAYSFRVPEYSTPVPAGKHLALRFETNANMIVSITSSEDAFLGDNLIGTHQHSWFETRDQERFLYNFAGQTPSLFVTLVNADAASEASFGAVRMELEDAPEPTDGITVLTPDDNASVSARIITVAGTLSPSIRQQAHRVALRTGSIDTMVDTDPQGNFSTSVVLSLGDNLIRLRALDSTGNEIAPAKMVHVRAVANADIKARNALVPSRAVFVLSWNKAWTDLDIYATNHSGETLWWDSGSLGQGYLDFDARAGYGPEVITYQTEVDPAGYADAKFDIDVHYFEGTAPVSYSLDLILNEQEPANIRRFRYGSVAPMTASSSAKEALGPDGRGPSRHNDVLTISCDPDGVCSLQAARSLVRSQ